MINLSMGLCPQPEGIGLIVKMKCKDWNEKIGYIFLNLENHTRKDIWMKVRDCLLRLFGQTYLWLEA